MRAATAGDQREGQRQRGRVGSPLQGRRESFDLSGSLLLVLWEYASRAAHCAVGALQTRTWTGSINWKQRSVDLRLSSSLAVDWANRFGERGRSSNESCLS